MEKNSEFRDKKLPKSGTVIRTSKCHRCKHHLVTVTPSRQVEIVELTILSHKISPISRKNSGTHDHEVLELYSKLILFLSDPSRSTSALPPSTVRRDHRRPLPIQLHPIQLSQNHPVVLLKARRSLGGTRHILRLLSATCDVPAVRGGDVVLFKELVQLGHGHVVAVRLPGAAGEGLLV